MDIFKRCNKLNIKGGRVAIIENARKEYIELPEQNFEKTNIFRFFLKLSNQYNNLHQYLFPKPWQVLLKEFLPPYL